MKKIVFRALIIGCGRIAGINGDGKTTHAGAMKANNKIDLVACVDTNLSKAKVFSKKYHCKYFNDLQSALLYSRADLISICTPDSTHYEIVKYLLRSNYPPKVIFLEKPVCLFDFEYFELKEIAKCLGILVVVNHTRRFNTKYKQLRELINTSYKGSLYRVNGTYYGGWLHNGVHLVDTISYLLDDEVRWLRLNDVIQSNNPNDPSIELTGQMHTSKAKVSLSAIDDSLYQLFDLDFWFSQGRLRIENFGDHIQMEKMVKNLIGERVLIKESINPSIEDTTEMENAIENICDYLNCKNSVILDLASLNAIGLTMKSIWQGRNLFLKEDKNGHN